MSQTVANKCGHEKDVLFNQKNYDTCVSADTLDPFLSPNCNSAGPGALSPYCFPCRSFVSLHQYTGVFIQSSPLIGIPLTAIYWL